MVVMNSVSTPHNGSIPMEMVLVTNLMGLREISVRMFTASPSTIDSVALIPIEMAGLTQMRIGRLKMEQMRTSTIH